MSILIINRFKNYSYSAYLKEITKEIVVLTKYPLPDEEVFKFVKNDSIFNEQELESEILELHKKYNFKLILAEHEFDLVLAGRMRDLLNISGQTEVSALAFRDKVIMKEYLNSIVKVPKFKRINSVEDLIDFSGVCEYPIIIKPIDSAGSSDVNKIDSYEELVAFINSRWREGLQVEEYIEGDMYHIDAIVKDKYQVVFSVSRYYQGCLAFNDSKSIGSYQLHPDDEMYNRLRVYLTKVLEALPCPEISAYHLEVFHTKDDDFVFCEIASRIGGAYILDTILNTYLVDMSSYWFRDLCGLDTDFEDVENPELLHGWLLIPPQKGKIEYIPDKVNFEWVKTFDLKGVVGDIYDKPSRSIDSIAGFVVEGATSQQVLERITNLDNWFRDEMKWRIVHQ